MKNKQFIIVALSIVQVFFCNAQETINANDPNSFIFGGDSDFNTATLELQEILLTDLEPDPGNTISFGVNPSDMEAGKPVTGAGGTSVNEDIWLNFTYRGINYRNARILVYANQPLPADLEIKIQVIATANTGGNYNPNPNYNPIVASTSEQVLVYDFASGYTGDGEGTGYQLRYTIDNPNGASLPTGFEIIYEIR
ncbi:MAG TPA: hypothetical protein ENH91_06820 [Leeuwenhoekiella sp.]|nr:hypothetical protein [Leeuwenhoekiella sp.]